LFGEIALAIQAVDADKNGGKIQNFACNGADGAAEAVIDQPKRRANKAKGANGLGRAQPQAEELSIK
jgi:hypothetical protein